MDIPVNVDVFCSDQRGGIATYVVLNPTNTEVTHLVVKDKKFPHAERLVSISLVQETTPHQITLRCTLHDLLQQEPFIETEYYQSQMPFFVGPLTLGGFTVHNTEMIPVEHERTPSGEVAVHRGAHVDATDGRVGKVDEFLVNQDNGHITHLVLREGHIWGQKEVRIPVSQIDHIEEDAVHLKLDKRSVAALTPEPAH